MMKGLYGLMRKKGVCVLPDFGSAGGHTGDYSTGRFEGRGKEESGSCVFPAPRFLTRSHMCCGVTVSGHCKVSQEDFGSPVKARAERLNADTARCHSPAVPEATPPHPRPHDGEAHPPGPGTQAQVWEDQLS